jgi:alanyl-tRNA synthetase
MKEAKEGEEVIVVLEKNSFLSEKGGQEWDKGFIAFPKGRV